MNTVVNVNHLSDRAELLRTTRRFFDERGFMEVQPPCLSRDCVVDAYLDPLTVDAREIGIADARLPQRFYLQTSPESAMKRMLAAGAPSIYSIGPVFRGGESGKLHNVEFTMLEWYEVDGDLDSAMQLTGDLVAQVLKADGYDSIRYRDVFREVIDIDPITASSLELIAAVHDIDAALAESIGDDRDQLLDVLLSNLIVPHLGDRRPVIVADYPLSQAALAKRSPRDPDCAARFELFSRGIELANGYDELLDADVLATRYAENNQKRVATGRSPLNSQTSLSGAMRSGMPQCSGVALGLDRLLMLMVDAECIDSVMPFSIWDA